MSEFRMNPDKLDTILATEEELLPSSGFLASVMEQVREEAVVPAPIPFPWKRVLPGILLIVILLGWFAVRHIQQGVALLRHSQMAVIEIPAVPLQSLQQAGWVALALAASLGCWIFARRLAGRSGLL